MSIVKSASWLSPAAWDEPLHLYICLANGTAFKLAYWSFRNNFHVAIERIGYFYFSKDYFAHADYVNEKLRLNNENDAKHLADWINFMIGQQKEIQGSYYINLCRKKADAVEGDYCYPIVEIDV